MSKFQSFQLTTTCDNGHIQTMTYGPGFTREWVEAQARILDGTSEMYVFKPGPESVIGKCGICGAQIKCEVQETGDA